MGGLIRPGHKLLTSNGNFLIKAIVEFKFNIRNNQPNIVCCVNLRCQCLRKWTNNFWMQCVTV